MIVFGFTGKMASGKGTATELVKQWFPGTPSVRFSDSLREFYLSFIFRFAYPYLRSPGGERKMSHAKLLWALHHLLKKIYGDDVADPRKTRELLDWIEGDFLPTRSWFIPSSGTRRDLQDISTKLRTLYREDILERAVRRRLIAAQGRESVAIIEGIRREVDIATFLTDPELNFRLVYVEADAKVRWERYRTRGENPGDAEMTFERFLEAGEQEAEQQIGGLKAKAHAIINNDTSPEKFAFMLRVFADHWMKECIPAK